MHFASVCPGRIELPFSRLKVWCPANWATNTLEDEAGIEPASLVLQTSALPFELFIHVGRSPGPRINQSLQSCPGCLNRSFSRTSQDKRNPACGLEPLSDLRRHPFCPSLSHPRRALPSGHARRTLHSGYSLQDLAFKLVLFSFICVLALQALSCRAGTKKTPWATTGFE